MGGEKKADLAVVNRNQFTVSFEFKFKNWLAIQQEAAVTVVKAVGKGITTTLDAAYQGVALGILSDFVIADICLLCSIPRPKSHSQFLSLCGGYRPLVESVLAGGTLEKGRNIAIMTGTNEAISLVLKSLRVEEDVHTSMMAGFGYGVMLSMVTGMKGPDVISVGVICGLFNGVMFKVFS